jgi:hypothetical protein
MCATDRSVEKRDRPERGEATDRSAERRDRPESDDA